VQTIAAELPNCKAMGLSIIFRGDAMNVQASDLSFFVFRCEGFGLATLKSPWRG
jgi:hypothetical protein